MIEREIRLERPLGGITTLRRGVPHLSDLAGLLVGEKPVVYADVKRDDLEYVRGLCHAWGLRYICPERALGAAGFHYEADSRMLLLGRDERSLRRAARVWRKNPLHPEWGRLLGYPECCVRAYREWKFLGNPKSRNDLDIVRFIRSRTRGAGPFSYILNNVYNFFSRLESGPGQESDIMRYQAIHRANARSDLATLNVIGWHPCSYRCGRSLRKGKRVVAFLEAHAPRFLAVLRARLGRPVLYFDKYQFVALNGAVVVDGSVRYEGVSAPYSLLPMARLKAIAAARRWDARWTPSGIAKPPLLLEFRP